MVGRSHNKWRVTFCSHFKGHQTEMSCTFFEGSSPRISDAGVVYDCMILYVSLCVCVCVCPASITVSAEEGASRLVYTSTWNCV